MYNFKFSIYKLFITWIIGCIQHASSECIFISTTASWPIPAVAQQMQAQDHSHIHIIHTTDWAAAQLQDDSLPQLFPTSGYSQLNAQPHLVDPSTSLSSVPGNTTWAIIGPSYAAPQCLSPSGTTPATRNIRHMPASASQADIAHAVFEVCKFYPTSYPHAEQLNTVHAQLLQRIQQSVVGSWPPALLPSVTACVSKTKELWSSMRATAQLTPIPDLPCWVQLQSQLPHTCARRDARTMTSADWLAMIADHQPVILEHAMSPDTVRHMSNWSTWASLGPQARAHVKASPGGVFEGPHPAWWWGPGSNDSQGHWRPTDIPAGIAEQLVTQDTVVHRPADLSMSMADWLRHLRSAGQEHEQSAWYIEYFSETQGMESVWDGLHTPEMPAQLDLQHRNLWFSPGGTLGKAHFDAFENILAPMVGNKTVWLLPPYAAWDVGIGHVREVMWSWHEHNASLTLGPRAESTSMVNLPWHVHFPDVDQWPDAVSALAHARTCTVQPGQALYLPGYWWHEVQSGVGGRLHSVPDDAEIPANIAVNWWYTPAYSRAFPCAACSWSAAPGLLGDVLAQQQE